ncbi:hybrid sensor histidine kinase/response regulator [Desulfonatronum thioautotrophicum]|uniref:hybrid sensor histidine kinase/response regulator n=1 Tax=Desulfonatronum thioautotrophicum TaxID=617001 RepID=UPI0005EB0F96|nr:response regulator [Desulfonatronum thioautotrophicum]
MSQTDQSPRVLLVDDNSDNLNLLMNLLKDRYVIRAARDGVRALALAESSPRPDIILLDVMMPDMDGYEVCRRLKANPVTRSIPVIFITARTAVSDEHYGLKLGAVDYIGKPFHPEIVLARLQNHLDLQRVRKDQQKLFQAVRNSSASIVITDVDGTIEYVNPAFTRTTGYEPHEALGQNPRVLKSDRHDDEFYAGMWRTIAAGQVWRGEILNRKKNGELYWESASISPVKDDDGRVVSYVAVKEDISDRKDHEQLKEDVDRIMRHDLRSPLGGIIGLAGVLLQEGTLAREQREMLRMLEESGQHMLRMIDSSLDLVKMETGSYQYLQRRVDALAVVQEALANLRPKLAAGSLQVAVTLNGQPAVEPFWVGGEERLLYSMLANLLLNAVEASPNGETIAVELSRNPEPILRIRNRGAVPEPARKNFFQKYMTYGKLYGTGLGTYSARMMADTMHYSLALDISDAEDTTTLVITAVDAPLVVNALQP